MSHRGPGRSFLLFGVLGAMNTIGMLFQGCKHENEHESRVVDIVYGDDDRVDYYNVSSSEVRARVSSSMAALVPKARLHQVDETVTIVAPSWGERAGLCSGEPFFDQPAAAFCAGVLVDWDLVLTAGHCARVVAIEDIAVVFGYYYSDPEQLSSEMESVNVVEIVAEALDPVGTTPRLDYAWLRLARAPSKRRQPSPLYVNESPLGMDSPVISIGTGGGVPMKVDLGGRVRDLGGQFRDYFVADTDTSRGSSGGAAFDASMVLAGVLVRGEPDLVETDGGCLRSVQETDGLKANEQFTYVRAAVADLCRDGGALSSICRAECGSPCQALPWAGGQSGASGCAIGRTQKRISMWQLLCALGAVWELMRRRSHSAESGI